MIRCITSQKKTHSAWISSSQATSQISYWRISGWFYGWYLDTFYCIWASSWCLSVRRSAVKLVSICTGMVRYDSSLRHSMRLLSYQSLISTRKSGETTLRVSSILTWSPSSSSSSSSLYLSFSWSTTAANDHNGENNLSWLGMAPCSTALT